MMIATMPKVGALEPGVPAFPVYQFPVNIPLTDERGRLLDELDTLIADYGAALAQRDEFARQVLVLEQRISLTKAALSGQCMMEMTR